MSTHEDKTGFEELYDNPEFQKDVETLAQKEGVTAPTNTSGSAHTKWLVRGLLALTSIGVFTQLTSCKKKYVTNNNYYTQPPVITPPDSTTNPGDTTINIITGGGTGDTLIVHNGDTTLARRVTVGVGSFAESYVDPLGDMAIVNKMNLYDTIAVDLGYYDIPSNPLGNTRSPLPQKAVGRIDISNINPNNNYEKPLYDAINAISGGFLTQAVYPGAHVPDFSKPAVRMAVENFIKTAGTETKGVLLKGIDNITNVSNQTASKPLIDGALSVLSAAGTALQGQGKAYIIGGGLFHSNYVTPSLANKVGSITKDIYLDINSPVQATDYNYYITGLRAMENGRQGDIHLLTYFNVAQNDTAANRTAAKDFRDHVLADARQPAGITLADGFFGLEDRYNNLGDLDKNKIATGIIAKIEKPQKKVEPKATPSPRDIAAGHQAAKELMAETKSYQQYLAQRAGEAKKEDGPSPWLM